jgi:hypothetical protein
MGARRRRVFTRELADAAYKYSEGLPRRRRVFTREPVELCIHLGSHFVLGSHSCMHFAPHQLNTPHFLVSNGMNRQLQPTGNLFIAQSAQVT